MQNPKMIGFLKLFSEIRRYYGRNSANNLEMRIVKENHVSQIRKFLVQNYYKTDPLHSCLKLFNNPRGMRAFEKHMENAFSSEISVMMLNERKEIAGLCLNRIIPQKVSGRKVDDDDFAKVVDFVDAINEKCDLHQKFGVDRYLKLEVLSLEPTSEKVGIDKKLVEFTRIIAKQNNIKLMRYDATGLYDAKNASNLGFTPVFSVRYEDYVMGNIPVFRPPRPHSEFSVFVHLLENSEGPNTNEIGSKRYGRPPSQTVY